MSDQSKTVNHYAEQFGAIVNDADPQNGAYGDAIVQGFLLALSQWRQYHIDMVKELERMNKQFQHAEADSAAAAFLLQQQTLEKGLNAHTPGTECTTATSSGSHPTPKA